ncbi:F-box protein At3g07870-like [Cornus florida]|uniref:F-box protein At3g07870-like n=1 Tax=Cornus florida TaxID=4283 RepID=UPI002899F34F|nr:F-box protein At3g07870-like [Cornus florida]
MCKEEVKKKQKTEINRMESSKKHSYTRGFPIMDLPDFIIMDILSRLPIRTLLQSRCVCKTWFNLPLDPYFNNVRLATSPSINIVSPSLNGCSLVELQDRDCNYTRLRYRLLWFRKLQRQMAMSSSLKLEFLGSCNGLLCFSDYYHNNVSMLNPIMGEYVALPKPKTETKKREKFYDCGLWVWK